MTVEQIGALFTDADGAYRFARWERPIVPVVFGVQEETLAVVKGACEAVVALAGHKMAETDPEMGANLMVFFFRDWRELLAVPDLGGLVPGLEGLVARLDAEGARQYRVFRFEPSGAIRACVVFLRMDAAMQEVPADELALAQMAQAILLWSNSAFRARSPLARATNGQVILRPEIADVIRASYDPVMPAVARDASHALRLAARMPARDG
ncbi:hypothetical protein [Tropicimonas marinistellae]|uniref:hypothetical protein n=1 Tax=Tropicimonas marinistellae TaxID=1739787 RepID=UPI00082FEAF3|nr:hypothetical protein [Tropicimonas marinistellae]